MRKVLDTPAVQRRWRAVSAREFGHLALLSLVAITPACGQDEGGSRAGELDSAERSIATQTPIVFRSGLAEGPGDLYVMAPDGTGLRRLTRDGDFSVPAWSPDGDSIAFRNNAEGTNAEVGVMNSDGSSPVLVTQGENPSALDVPVRWSPDGEELAYGSWPEPRASSVWIISRMGGEPRPLLESAGRDQEAVAWNPVDASEIVFTEFVSTRTSDLWLFSLSNAEEPINLTQGRVFAPRYPEWSPDGSRIAFAGYFVLEDGTVEGLGTHGAGAAPPDVEVFVIDVATQELTRVTDDAWEDGTPTWAPDGEHLLIPSARDGDADLWLIPLADPEQAVNLIDDSASPADDVMPHWYKAP